MSKPLLQVALDHLDMASALEASRALAEEVDVLEMGTILCYAEGSKTVGLLRALYPEKKIVADLKVADAGGTVAEIVFSQGADWMTVICCAPYATMEAARKVAKSYNGDLQIELYGEWTFEQAAKTDLARDIIELVVTRYSATRGSDTQPALPKLHAID